MPDLIEGRHVEAGDEIAEVLTGVIVALTVDQRPVARWTLMLPIPHGLMSGDSEDHECTIDVKAEAVSLPWVKT